MPFCIQCGHTANYQIPQGDSRLRLVCSNCHHIHYDNPKTIVGTLCIYNNKILLCKRAIEPRLGYWTLPAGFLELGESMQDGAIRETNEEACACATQSQLYALFDLPHLGQIHAMYLAQLKDGQFSAGAESLECRLFDPTELPNELSFKTVALTLKYYKKDVARFGNDWANYPLHQTVLDNKSHH